ncbi:hypothetical protein [Calothrix sp. 336/3]|uniref:hypothetical protein n=1 Tax=Calothrix sp. 336/3 TaxID=1337936 RepID=UPI000A655356|nr:hypothetical protein [Calothrix sp. 336/3]
MSGVIFLEETARSQSIYSPYAVHIFISQSYLKLSMDTKVNAIPPPHHLKRDRHQGCR